MSTLSDLRDSIRQRIHDYMRPAALYVDGFYDGAIKRGLRRVNLDLEQSYVVEPSSTIPAKYEYLVELRGTIEMCRIRGGEGASSDVSDLPSPEPTMVQVQNLLMQGPMPAIQGAGYWLELAAQLEKEYETLIGRFATQDDLGADKTIQQTELTRVSLRNGLRTPYALVRPSKPTTLVGIYEGSGLARLSWEPVYESQFSSYRLERAVALDMVDCVLVKLVSDNHEIDYKDEPGSGTWYYRLRTRYCEGPKLDTLSNVVSVVVP